MSEFNRWPEVRVNPPNKIEINVSGFSDEETLHGYFAAAFDFPSYYRANWDAFFDCVMYDAELKMPAVLIVRGIDVLRSRVPHAAEKFEKCLSDYAAAFPERRVVFERP